MKNNFFLVGTSHCARILLILFFMWSHLAAEDQVQAQSVLFENGVMKMSGPLSWHSELGFIEAKSAEMQFGSQWQDYPEHIVLKEDVEILLKKHGKITSGFASIDREHGVATFHGMNDEKIHYVNFAEGLQINSLKMELHFDRQQNEKVPLKFDKITAEGDVEIVMDDLSMFGDCILIKEFTDEGHISKGRLIQTNLENGCRVVTGKEHEVIAQEILFDFVEKKAYLEQAKGKWTQIIPPIDFVTTELSLNLKDNQMILHPPLIVEGIGRLQSDGELIIQRSSANTIHTICCEGPSSLIFKDPVNGSEYRLEVSGPIVIDHLNHLITLDSPRNSKGQVAHEEQIHFEDEKGKVEADSATLIYKEENGTMVPISIELIGEVQITNGVITPIQYALADRAYLDFKKHTLNLYAVTRPRVLFYDILNKIQASAKSLTINRDPVNNADSIKSGGDVRFHLAEDEFNELKKRFILNENS